MYIHFVFQQIFIGHYSVSNTMLSPLHSLSHLTRMSLQGKYHYLHFTSEIVQVAEPGFKFIAV